MALKDGLALEIGRPGRLREKLGVRASSSFLCGHPNEHLGEP